MEPIEISNHKIAGVNWIGLNWLNSANCKWQNVNFEVIKKFKNTSNNNSSHSDDSLLNFLTFIVKKNGESWILKPIMVH